MRKERAKLEEKEAEFTNGLKSLRFWEDLERIKKEKEQEEISASPEIKNFAGTHETSNSEINVDKHDAGSVSYIVRFLFLFCV